MDPGVGQDVLERRKSLLPCRESNHDLSVIPLCRVLKRSENDVPKLRTGMSK